MNRRAKMNGDHLPSIGGPGQRRAWSAGYLGNWSYQRTIAVWLGHPALQRGRAGCSDSRTGRHSDILMAIARSVNGKYAQGERRKA